MDRVQLRAEDFADAEQVVQVGAAEVPARVAVAGFVERTRIVLVVRVLDADVAVACKQVAVTRVARRHDAVEHIDTATYPFHQIFRLPDAHQVSWFIGRDLRADVLQNTVHVFLRLADRQTADSVAIKANLYQTFHRDIT